MYVWSRFQKLERLWQYMVMGPPDLSG